MKTSALKFAAVAAMVCGFAAAAAAGWEYEPDTSTISDGNWTFKVSEWKDGATTFKTTVKAAGCLEGSGELDLAAAEEDLGRKWVYQNDQFSGCKTITSIKIPASQTSLPQNFAYGCTALTTFEATTALTTYGNYCVRDCSALESFYPEVWSDEGAYKLGEGMFWGCTKLHYDFVWNPNNTYGWRCLRKTGMMSMDYMKHLAPATLSQQNMVSLDESPSLTTLYLSPYMTCAGDNDSNYKKLLEVYAPGDAFTQVKYRAINYTADYACRIFVDPEMFPAWLGDTIAGYAISRPTDAEITRYMTSFDVLEAEARELVIGVWNPNQNKKMWLVRWQSPFNPELDEDGSLVITSDPAGYGVLSPAKNEIFKRFSLDTPGATQVCTASAEHTEGTERYNLSGYTIETWSDGAWGAPETFKGETSYTYTQDGTVKRLTWLYRKNDLYPFAAAPFRAESGSVALDPLPEGGEYEKGTTVTATVTPASGFAFGWWRGTLPDGIDVTSPSVTFEINGPYALEAVCTNVAGWYAYPAAAPEVVTDGNWAFAVSEWTDGKDTFKTATGVAGCLGGEGVLDLSRIEEDLGRKWSYQDNQFQSLSMTELRLSSQVTSVPKYFAHGCKSLRHVVATESLTTINHYAFQNCSALETFEPAPWSSGFVTSWGQEVFRDCASLQIGDFVMSKDLQYNWRNFWGCNGITSIDYSQRPAAMSLDYATGTGLKTVILSPAQTSIQTEGMYPNVETIYVTRDVVTSVSWYIVSKTDYKCRIFADPDTDEGWLSPKIAGYDVLAPTDADIEAYVAKFGGTEDEARRNIFGIWSPNVNGKVWLVKWVSPFRKRGLMVIIR